jgi:cytochrome d ubiquinol oxidase subunit II
MVSNYTDRFWQMLNPSALPADVVSSAMISMHGGIVLARRTEGVIQQRAIRGAADAAMNPFLTPSSTMPNASFTVWDSASSHLTLDLRFWATLMFMPLIAIYTCWACRGMRGKVSVAQTQPNEHTAY